MDELSVHQKAKILAVKKDMSLEKLIRKALNDNVFINSETKEPRSLSWVKTRLKSSDQRVLSKLESI
jgi:hypothetical protein